MVGYHPEAINEPLTSAEYSEAGLASGIVTRMIIQPLDVLKIRFQLQEEPIRGKRSGKYKGVLQSIFLITREEGANAFWKGHIPAQGLSAMYGLVQFSSFEWMSREAGKLIPSEDPAVRSTSDFVCGALSGCLAMTANGLTSWLSYFVNSQRMAIIRGRQMGLDMPTLAKQFNTSKSVIWATLNTPNRSKTTGKYLKTSSGDDRITVRMSKKNPRLTSTNINSELKYQYGVQDSFLNISQKISVDMASRCTRTLSKDVCATRDSSEV
uniref:Uncharacterized protein n=4 Tax=Caenorhabditis japonica TaxID=281687 RepID=A0A8R1ENE9_CAEJA